MKASLCTWSFWGGCVWVLMAGCNFEDGLLEQGMTEELDQGNVSDLSGKPPVVDMPGKPIPDGGTKPLPDQGVKPLPDMSKPLPDMFMIDMTTPPDQGIPMDMGSPQDQGGGEPVCGNGVLEPGELCDGDCPAACSDGDVCTQDIRAGSDAQCNVICSHPTITTCTSNDGCCPSGCTNAQDSDCQSTMTFDCANAMTWPSAWSSVEGQTRGDVNSSRTTGVCNGMSYTMRGSLSQNASLTQAARCMAVWKKDNPGASGQELLSRLTVEVANAGYTGSSIQLLGAGGNSATSARDQITSSMQYCTHISTPSFADIGVGYVDNTYGPADHAVMVILGE